MLATARRRLFIDDEEIENYEGLKRTVHQPVHHPANPVLKPERPWEGQVISHYGTLLYDEDEQLFRLWYFTNPGSEEPIRWDGQMVPGRRSILGYATSRDAIHWDRPDLGQIEYEGSRDNNIVRIGIGQVEGVGIIDDRDEADPNRRYKALYWHRMGKAVTQADGALVYGHEDESDGMWVSFSPDGLHWTDSSYNPVRCGSDTSHYVVKDPATGKYFGYGRFTALKVGDEFMRRVDRIQSDDFEHWSGGITVMEADHMDAMPMPDTQIYGMTVDLYEGLYLGGVWMYHRGRDHTIDTQLAVSRDGLHWDRVGDNAFYTGHGPSPTKQDVDRQVFLPLGPIGSGYAGMVRPAGRFITLDDTIHMLIGLVEGEHGDLERKFQSKRKPMPTTLGLATLRRDGFVSLDAGDDEGSVTTTPFDWTGEALHINADATGGSVRAALLDADGQPLPGFEQSAPVEGDQLDAPVQWLSDAAPTATQPIRLQLSARNAMLYSYWFT